jgi:hypothetical protein
MSQHGRGRVAQRRQRFELKRSAQDDLRGVQQARGAIAEPQVGMVVVVDFSVEGESFGPDEPVGHVTADVGAGVDDHRSADGAGHFGHKGHAPPTASSGLVRHLAQGRPSRCHHPSVISPLQLGVAAAHVEHQAVEAVRVGEDIGAPPQYDYFDRVRRFLRNKANGLQDFRHVGRTRGKRHESSRSPHTHRRVVRQRLLASGLDSEIGYAVPKCLDTALVTQVLKFLSCWRR